MMGENKRDCIVNYFALAMKNTSLQYTTVMCNVRLVHFSSLILITNHVKKGFAQR